MQRRSQYRRQPKVLKKSKPKPKCANCGEAHTANWKAVYKKAEERAH